jgi:hypothetical protein
VSGSALEVHHDVLPLLLDFKETWEHVSVLSDGQNMADLPSEKKMLHNECNKESMYQYEYHFRKKRYNPI